MKAELWKTVGSWKTNFRRFHFLILYFSLLHVTLVFKQSLYLKMAHISIKNIYLALWHKEVEVEGNEKVPPG